MGHSSLAVIMKCFALFALASVALARPADDAAAVAPLVYGLPYGALAAPGYALPYAAPHVAYAHAPVVYNALESGLVYPVAEPYVHDATGDVSDNSSPEAEAYVHGPTGDARKKRDADAQVLLAGAHPYAYGYAGLPLALPVVAPFVAHPNGALVPLEPEDVVKARADHLAAVAEALEA